MQPQSTSVLYYRYFMYYASANMCFIVCLTIHEHFLFQVWLVGGLRFNGAFTQLWQHNALKDTSHSLQIYKVQHINMNAT